MRIPVLVLLAAASLAVGCSKTSDYRTSTYQAPPQTAAVTQPAPPARIPLTDPQIIGLLDFANQQEIQEGQMAQQRAASVAVRDFATRMQRDHMTLQQGGSNLASRLNVVPAPPMASQSVMTAHRAEADALNMKSGYDFDRAYIQHNIMEHQRLIAQLDEISRDARNPELQSIVAQARPAMQAHLQAAMQIDQLLRTAPPPNTQGQTSLTVPAPSPMAPATVQPAPVQPAPMQPAPLQSAPMQQMPAQPAPMPGY